MSELETWRDETVQRLAVARRLHADVEDLVATTFPQMVSIAEEIKHVHPELTEQIDQVIGHSMLRSTLMPQMMAGLFWLQTEAPPEVIEGEIVEDTAPEGETEEVEDRDE